MSDPDPLEIVFKKLCAMEVPLNERLALFSAAVREHALPYADAYDELVARLQSADAGASAPQAGDQMPAFALPDHHNRIYELAEMLACGPVVVSFNRGHWCQYCLTELDALKRGLQEICAAGGQVVSIMPETREFTAQVAEAVDFAFPILSDENNGYALMLNLVIWMGDRARSLWIADGVQLDYSQGNGSWFLPIPATFVIGTDGQIIARKVDPDFRKRMDIEDILSALHQARQ